MSRRSAAQWGGRPGERRGQQPGERPGDRRRDLSGGLARPPAGPLASVPVLVRVTVSAGLVLALAASVYRADTRSGAGPQAGPRSRAAAAQAAPAQLARAAGRGSGCRIRYGVVAEQGSRYTLMVAVTNNSGHRMAGWKVRWQSPPGQRIAYGLNAMVSSAPDGATAVGIGPGGSLAAGATADFGLVATNLGGMPTLRGFSLDGQPCTAATAGPDGSGLPTPAITP